MLLGLFAACADARGVGIYGVLSYLVSQRTREIGIRIAVGAGPGEIVRLVLGRGLGLALIGVGVGLVVAFVATRVMGSLLYEIQPRDPATFIERACGPHPCRAHRQPASALRAMRVDPIVALRTE